MNSAFLQRPMSPQLRRFALPLLLLLPSLLHAQPRRPDPRTFVIVHGAWGGGWDWQRVDSALMARGHRVYRVTLTGLGERAHLASPSIGLQTHIMDVVNTIRFESLRNVTLVGHSYGGMVVTGAADQIADRVARVVYVDAFVPDSGDTMAALAGADFNAMVAPMLRDGMIVPLWAPDSAPAPKDTPHPLRTMTDTLRLTSPAARRIPGQFILTMERGATTDAFSPSAARAATRGWPVDTIVGDHTPERSAVPALVRQLLKPRR